MMFQLQMWHGTECDEGVIVNTEYTENRKEATVILLR
jgi:hypothetical protein